MARIESVAIGGFYPTPERMVAWLRNWFEPPPGNSRGVSRIRVLDPCAGEGKAFGAFPRVSYEYSAIELEPTRYASLTQVCSAYSGAVNADAFHVRVDGECGVLYLNPPYDTDPVFGRLEERFLDRFTPTLAQDGWLAFVVPFYALKASARTLSRYYRDLQCFRFPTPEWEGYRQVVLFARRNEVSKAQGADMGRPDIEAQVLQWAADADSIPEWSEYPEHQQLTHSVGLTHLRLTAQALDLAGVETLDPWRRASGSPVTNFAPPADILKSFRRVYPVASRPRAAHLAAALAAGVFNGLEVTSDKEGPPLLVKGVFDREWRTIEVKETKSGTSETQVQQPKLTVSVLDVSTGRFHDIISRAVASGSKDPANMTMGDLFEAYGPSLMRGMLDACPALYDPSRPEDLAIPLPALERPLYAAQADAVRTAVKLYAQDPQQGIYVLGEIGSGKSQVSLAITRSLGRKRTLIMCPPHLLEGWPDQIRSVLGPNTDIRILDTLADVDSFFSAGDEPRYAVLSRERAKLGHAWESVSGPCPKCGAPLARDGDFAAKRSRCGAKCSRPRNKAALWLQTAVSHSIPELLHSPATHYLAPPRLFRYYQERNSERVEAEGPVTPAMQASLEALVDLVVAGTARHASVLRWLVWAYPECTEKVVRACAAGPVTHEERSMLAELLLASENDPVALWREVSPLDTHLNFQLLGSHRQLHGGPPASGCMWGGEIQSLSRGENGPRKNHISRGTIAAFRRLIDAVLTSSARLSMTECGEPLFYATSPHRIPLANYINKRYRTAYDCFIFDECQDAGNLGSAQTKAALRLMGGRCLNMLLTGSWMNGYAESVFANMYGSSPKFRAEFERGDMNRFIDRYGFWKRVVEDKPSKVTSYGAMTDRETTRRAGTAPGILSLYSLEYLLPSAVTLQKEDLKLGIPECHEEHMLVDPTAEMQQNYEYLLTTLIDTIKQHRNEEGKAGKLWGALAHLPGYLDLACVGNGDGTYTIRWPENTPELGGKEIVSVPLMPDGEILPKEQAMIDECLAQRARGRRSMVLGTHLHLLPRYVRLLKEAGLSVAHLEAAKVPTDKRQSWIDKNVVGKRVDVLVVNPVTVQTGLNNLVYFCTEIWMENPGCSPHIYRQTSGRVDRIGQQKETEILFLTYDGTAQTKLHQLLMHKVGVAKAVDGLDPEEALRSAGMLDHDEGGYSSFSVGKQLYQMIVGE